MIRLVRHGINELCPQKRSQVILVEKLSLSQSWTIILENKYNEKQMQISASRHFSVGSA